jgi:hypothetical protein
MEPKGPPQLGSCPAVQKLDEVASLERAARDHGMTRFDRHFLKLDHQIPDQADD